MRLDQELVRRGLCESRTEAQELIASGAVVVLGTMCTKQTRQVSKIDILEVTARRRFVSRGGEKLQGILREIFRDDEEIRNFCRGTNALDIGSSTGGFTDCLLSCGTAHVDAVDVGTLQLHDKLRSDVRISAFENTDIRNFKSKTEYDLIVTDLSFISLTSVFDDVIRFGRKGTRYFLLIKPQFEVGKGNTKKGIVKDQALVEEVLEMYTKLAEEKGMTSLRILPCTIRGGDGNQEYFLYGTL